MPPLFDKNSGLFSKLTQGIAIVTQVGTLVILSFMLGRWETRITNDITNTNSNLNLVNSNLVELKGVVTLQALSQEKSSQELIRLQTSHEALRQSLEDTRNWILRIEAAVLERKINNAKF